MVTNETEPPGADTKPAGAKGKMVYATEETAPPVPGRRAFMTYRDLGVSAASGGAMRAQIMSSTEADSKPTGWHYHLCDGQFVYVLKGWVDLSFEDGTSIRLKEKESLYLPGGWRHQETATSKELEILEVAVPADLGTVSCPSPFD
jgi:quercetin dioxygenase-like cupin family protein